MGWSLSHSVATWSSPETTGPRPPPCAAFSFTKVDLSRVVMFGGRQRHQRVNEVHILDVKSWVNKLWCNIIGSFIFFVCFLFVFVSLFLVFDLLFLSTGVVLSCPLVQLTFGRKRGLYTLHVLWWTLRSTLWQQTPSGALLIHSPAMVLATCALANFSQKYLYFGGQATVMLS